VPAKLVSDDDLLARLTGLFRDRGFEAASLTDIASATGLQKSSLYHRFPGGKQQMAAEVTDRVGECFTADVLAPLESDGPLPERVRRVGEKLTRFYENGHRSCLLDVLSIGDPGADTAGRLRSGADDWVGAFATIASLGGADGVEAVARAQDAVAAIEGGLVLARVTGDNRAFLRSIERLADVLLATPQTRS
jgi:AcrR family transcriptional regulator